MAESEINVFEWTAGESYNKYDPVYFNKSLVGDFTVLNFTNNWTAETGNWSQTEVSDGDFYGESVRTDPSIYSNAITGFHSLASVKFPINPLSDYEASVYIAKKDDSVSTDNPYDQTIFDNGAGLRVMFYDSNGDQMYAGVNFVKNHKLISVNKISSTDWQNLKLDLSFRDIPQFSNLAVSGSLDLVVYRQKKGSIYFSGAKIYNKDKYHYATEDHVSSFVNSPTGTGSMWTQKLQNQPSYGSSIAIKTENKRTNYDDGYYRITQNGINSLKFESQLKFEGKTDAETKSILHFLQSKKGANPFYFTMPEPYDKELPYYCDEYEYSITAQNNNVITAKLSNDTQSVLTKAGIFLSDYWFPDWEPQDYSINDVAFFEDQTYTGDENYHYRKSDESSILDTTVPTLNDNWTKDLFFWKPSIGTSIQKRPRIVTNDNFKYKQRKKDGINHELLELDLTFNQRDDSEAAAILHFLENKRGYKLFRFLPPRPYCHDIYYSGGGTTIYAELPSYDILSVNDRIIFSNENDGYTDVERTINSIELISGDSDYNFDNASVKIELNKTVPTYYLSTDGWSNSDGNHISVLKNFICEEWSNNYVFKDNNNISAKFIEYANTNRSKPDLLIDGDIFVDVGSPQSFNIKAKDLEGLSGYRFYNSTDTSVPAYTSTGVHSFSVDEDITFTQSGLNVLKLDVQNNLGAVNEISYDVVVGKNLTVNVQTNNGMSGVFDGNKKPVNFYAKSLSFISGYKLFYTEYDDAVGSYVIENGGTEPDYTPVDFTNYRLTNYNKYLTGITSISLRESRVFNFTEDNNGQYRAYLKVKDMAGNEESGYAQIIVDNDVDNEYLYGTPIVRDSVNNTYYFEQKYYKDRNHSNKNFLNTGFLTAIVDMPEITGDAYYEWTVLDENIDSPDATHNGASIPTVYEPTGFRIGADLVHINQYGDHIRVGCGLIDDNGDPVNEISKSVSARQPINVSVTGLGNNGRKIGGEAKINFVFNWVLD